MSRPFTKGKQCIALIDPRSRTQAIAIRWESKWHGVRWDCHINGFIVHKYSLYAAEGLLRRHGISFRRLYR